MSLDVLNEHLQAITVCPLTAQLHPTWRTRLAVRVARKNAEIAVDQMGYRRAPSLRILRS